MTEVAGSVPSSTGNEAVDAVVEMVAGLEDRPLSDHAAVFEEAHAQLRRALDQQPGTAS
jgi:hypothetical protein